MSISTIFLKYLSSLIAKTSFFFKNLGCIKIFESFVAPVSLRLLEGLIKAAVDVSKSLYEAGCSFKCGICDVYEQSTVENVFRIVVTAMLLAYLPSLGSIFQNILESNLSIWTKAGAQ